MNITKTPGTGFSGMDYVEYELEITPENLELRAFGPESKGIWGSFEKEISFKNPVLKFWICEDEDGFNYTHLDVYPGKYANGKCYFHDDLYEEYYHPSHFGLIYTCELFKKLVNDYMHTVPGFPEDAKVGYTEQGMQGPDYVSMEGNEAFDNWFINLCKKV